MKEEEKEKFCEQYKFIEKRAEEYIKIFRPRALFSGIDVEGNHILANYSEYSYGESFDDYDYLPIEALDENVELSVLYAEEIKKHEDWKKAEKEAQEKRDRESAEKQIAYLKEKFNLK